jgi:hypothetical protein
MEPADRQGKVRRVSPPRSQSHLPADRECPRKPRVEQSRVESRGLRLKVDDARYVHVQPDEVAILVWQQRLDLAHHKELRDAKASNELDSKCEVDVDQRRLAERCLDHQAHQVAALRRRKHSGDRREQRWRIADRILSEKDVIERVIPDPCQQRILHDRPVNPNQTTHAR